VVVVVIADGVITRAVFGFDKQYSGAERAVGVNTVLVSDGWCWTGGNRLLGIEADGLLTFGNQAFIGI
jgi:hypothetical protein